MSFNETAFEFRMLTLRALEIAKLSKANRNKPGNGKVGAVAWNNQGYHHSACNFNPTGGPMEVDDVTVPGIIHAEMAALMNRTGYADYLLCTESPCINCAYHLHIANLGAIFYLEEYRDPAGIDFLVSQGWQKLDVITDYGVVHALYNPYGKKSTEAYRYIQDLRK